MALHYLNTKYKEIIVILFILEMKGFNFTNYNFLKIPRRFYLNKIREFCRNPSRAKMFTLIQMLKKK